MSAAQKSQETLPFEAELAALEALVERLEQGEVPLADALAAYETGLAHAQRCEALLAEAQARIDALGQAQTQADETQD